MLGNVFPQFHAGPDTSAAHRITPRFLPGSHSTVRPAQGQGTAGHPPPAPALLVAHDQPTISKTTSWVAPVRTLPLLLSPARGRA